MATGMMKTEVVVLKVLASSFRVPEIFMKQNPTGDGPSLIASGYSQDTLILIKENLTWKDALKYCRNHHHDQQVEKRSSAIKVFPFTCHENKLILINETLTWKEALRYCRNHHHDLVSVRTEEMQLWVKEVAQNASTEHVWLGLRHTCALGFWYWVNGEMICYQDWAPGNGTGFEDCSHEERTGAVQSGGEQKWISLPQSKKLNFICSTYEDN
ncbi:FRAS1-related extracellular matrix protein 1-like [Hemibagrus wyckioides]|uniref:FRAS1-related extracellular matrix protein 1-like n=1 Tax=Hemibagrus wyckioides TaxID=337641 RepID=UPI00266D01C9|nr:FRAS1-related extracellular matrix protein 1-like [Hemibagrus wyckioides]